MGFDGEIAVSCWKQDRIVVLDQNGCYLRSHNGMDEIVPGCNTGLWPKLFTLSCNEMVVEAGAPQKQNSSLVQSQLSQVHPSDSLAKSPKPYSRLGFLCQKPETLKPTEFNPKPCTIGNSTGGIGRLMVPSGIAWGEPGQLYVAELGGSRVRSFGRGV